MNEEKWIDPGSKCDCCSRKRSDDEPYFTEEHCTMGGSGFNFNWCPECEKDRSKDCDQIISDYISTLRLYRRN